MKTKKDIMGNTLTLKDTKIYFYTSDNLLYCISEFIDKDTAKKEFNRRTNSYRGCGKKEKRRKHSQATVYYNQLIIQL